MTRRKSKQRGFLTPDTQEHDVLIEAARNSGWTIIKIAKQHSNSSDSFIAETYGKKRNVLLTHDKTAYKSNIDEGFVAYIEHDAISKNTLNTFCENVRSNVLASFSINEIKGFRILVDKTGKNIRKY